MVADISQIQELINENKLEEAKALLIEHLKTPLTDAEKGEIYTKLASLYLEVTNRLNRTHLETLEKTQSALHSIDKAERDIKDKIDLTAAQAKIKEM